MVQIAHSGINEEKINEILLAAQKRFGMYGYSKTTMHEIADDLGISKSTLYYYYPDKDNLFRAVFEKEKLEFIDQLHQAIEKSDNAIELLYQFVTLRMNNFRIFNNLSRAGLDDIKGIKLVVKDLWLLFLEKEKEELKNIFIKGIHNGTFCIQDKDELANLLVDSLRGISHIYLHNKDIYYMNEEDFSRLNKRIHQFITIFIKGISA
jgi:AcrR family transcriptional regulator